MTDSKQTIQARQQWIELYQQTQNASLVCRLFAPTIGTILFQLWGGGHYLRGSRERSLKIREQALGPEDPDVARSLNNLAATYIHQGRYAEAKPLLRIFN